MTAWLLADPWFRAARRQGALAADARTLLLSPTLAELATLVAAPLFVTDADRREELARVVCTALGITPAGERPEAAFARGVPVRRLRYLYTIIGGALVGIAGAAYSLDVKIGWSEGATRGLGWIALAIVIFGGWSPIRGALGALMFGATKALATVLQREFPEVSVVAFNALPWLLMILVLVLRPSGIMGRRAGDRA